MRPSISTRTERVSRLPKPRIPIDHLLAVDARDLHAGRQPQRLRDAGGARTPDILAGDHVDGGRGLQGLDRLFGGRGHFDLRQLFEAQVLERPRTCSARSGDLRVVGLRVGYHGGEKQPDQYAGIHHRASRIGNTSAGSPTACKAAARNLTLGVLFINMSSFRPERPRANLSVYSTVAEAFGHLRTVR